MLQHLGRAADFTSCFSPAELIEIVAARTS